MNRLIIIGNGFDLAHGLPTSYKDFIDDYWGNVIQESKKMNVYEDTFFTLKVNQNSIGEQGYVEFTNNVNSYMSLIRFLNKYQKYSSFKFNNNFFKIINDHLNVENWVDIENLYYSILKERAKQAFVKFNYPWDVSQLNTEFEQIKNLLEEYLKEKVIAKYRLDFKSNQNANYSEIYKCLQPISLLSNEDSILDEFIKEDDVNEIKDYFEKERKETLVNNLYFLSFNYTPLASVYCESLCESERIESKINFIHGSLGNHLENKLNFGFGDEMDEDYKSIENLNDNEYLKNFKSFKYLQNSNYNDLLRVIGSEKFQVLIFGHSCGLSDRTLLNTVFEHENCRSIKVFYHRREDGSDNYTEIIQNISRHFNKKKLMREKIVNKTLCKPLPQIQLAKK